MKDRMQQEKWIIPELEQVPEQVHHSILGALQQVNELPESFPRKKVKVFRKEVILVAAVIGMGLMTACAVNLYKQRMEAMNQEKLEMYFTQVQTEKGESEHFSRVFTEEESRRYEALNKAYEEKGKFPKGELILVSNLDYRGKGIGFYPDRRVYILPDTALTDEELLQIIDFQHKEGYSLEKVNKQIEDGVIDNPLDAIESKEEVPVETSDLKNLKQEEILNQNKKLVIKYAGGSSIEGIAAGKKWIYLAGNRGIERMRIGESGSQVFFGQYLERDEDITVCDMAEAPDESLYVIMFIKKGETDETQIWHISNEGKLINCIQPEIKRASRIAIDGQGNLYVRDVIKHDDTLVWVYDKEGTLFTQIKSEHKYQPANDMCCGKDGKIYMLCTEGKEKRDTNTGILRIDLQQNQAVQIADDILPTHCPIYSIIATGSTSDFVIGNANGVYTYNVGDKEGKEIMKMYEAPFVYDESALTVLSDGRLLAIESKDYLEIKKEEYDEYLRNPDNTYLYYMPTCQ